MFYTYSLKVAQKSNYKFGYTTHLWLQCHLLLGTNETKIRARILYFKIFLLILRKDNIQSSQERIQITFATHKNIAILCYVDRWNIAIHFIPQEILYVYILFGFQVLFDRNRIHSCIYLYR